MYNIQANFKIDSWIKCVSNECMPHIKINDWYQIDKLSVFQHNYLQFNVKGVYQTFGCSHNKFESTIFDCNNVLLTKPE